MLELLQYYLKTSLNFENSLKIFSKPRRVRSYGGVTVAGDYRVGFSDKKEQRRLGEGDSMPNKTIVPTVSLDRN